MKLQKNKTVFVLVLTCVILFVALYGMMTFGKEKKEVLKPDRIPMPDLEEMPKEYGTKLEAIEAIKKEREVIVPQVYPDHMVDEKGYFNPDYMEFEKQRIIDSLFASRKFNVRKDPVQGVELGTSNLGAGVMETVSENEEGKQQVSMQELTLSHQLFFASNPITVQRVNTSLNEKGVFAFVDGAQTVRGGHRLVLRLAEDVQINGRIVTKGTRFYGFVKMRPNRVMVDIAKLGDHIVTIKAHDLQDGQEGLYMENYIKGELMETSRDGALKEVNLPGLPQLGGIKRIFQRNNSAVKVFVMDQYQIVLKSRP
ncbi:conjugative transposon protein TraM [Flagellimonas olearia]|nr:conjugative transposon protein TraM [Allomuricauda olearia]